MSKQRNRGLNRRRGATLVEFGFVLPVITLLFFGVLEVGRTLLLQHSADTAAYEGTRAAIVPGATAEDAIQAAGELLEAARISEYTIEVDPEEIEEGTAVVSVEVSVPIEQNSWVVPTFFSGTSVKSIVTLFSERPPVVKLSGIDDAKKKLKSTKNKAAAD